MNNTHTSGYDDEGSPHVRELQLQVVRSDEKPRVGRPRTFTIRKFIRVCHYIESGQSITMACRLEGVTYALFLFRVSKSPRLKERQKKAEEIRFNLRHEQALASVMAAGEKSWMAHAWWLERNLPQLYALRATNRDTPPEKLIVDRISMEELASYGEISLRMAREKEERDSLKAARLQEATPEPAQESPESFS